MINPVIDARIVWINQPADDQDQWTMAVIVDTSGRPANVGWYQQAGSALIVFSSRPGIYGRPAQGYATNSLMNVDRLLDVLALCPICADPPAYMVNRADQLLACVIAGRVL